MRRFVSIPFKRESPFGPSFSTSIQKVVKRFNSLQTGKSFRTQSEKSAHCTLCQCFNSLQTGKSFRTYSNTTGNKWVDVVFQFPSNGKVLSDGATNYQEKENQRVSIPFKRESPFGRRQTPMPRHSRASFQFPSNGKVLSDVAQEVYQPRQTRFQFPSNGKVLSDRRQMIVLIGSVLTVSIPFKRESPFGLFSTRD